MQQGSPLPPLLFNKQGEKVGTHRTRATWYCPPPPYGIQELSTNSATICWIFESELQHTGGWILESDKLTVSDVIYRCLSKFKPWSRATSHQQRFEPPYITSLNSGARYDLTPTIPSFQNPIHCTPVHNQAEIISPFTPPQIHKDSQGDDIPKSLNYDPTKTPWELFNQELCRHARNKYWTSMECKSNFMYMYVLDSEAAEYFAALNQREPDLPFFDELSKMRDRFKGWESQETSQPVFHNRSPD